MSTTPLLWTVTTIKLVVLAVVCVAMPFQGVVLLVTNLLLVTCSSRRDRGYMFTVMLAVNAVLWLVAGLSFSGASPRVCVLFAFLMTVAIWLPIRVDAAYSGEPATIRRRR